MDALELRLSPHLQDVLKVRAVRQGRSVEDEARALLEAVLEPGTPTDQLEQLSVLDEAQLWHLARQQVPEEKSERMQALSEQLQAEGLSSEESEEVRRLQRYAERVMLLRAEAAALLKRRGHNVDGLRTPL